MVELAELNAIVNSRKQAGVKAFLLYEAKRQSPRAYARHPGEGAPPLRSDKFYQPPVPQRRYDGKQTVLPRACGARTARGICGWGAAISSRLTPVVCAPPAPKAGRDAEFRAPGRGSGYPCRRACGRGDVRQPEGGQDRGIIWKPDCSATSASMRTTDREECPASRTP